ncbi:MAG: sensor protein [Gemmatimonadetes bacterium]|nr:sensor protein [Gemmatimonadota bacterium]
MPTPDRRARTIPHGDAVALLDVLPDGLVVLDGDWRCRYANLAVESFVHRSRDEIVGRHVCEILDVPVGGDFTTRLDRVVATQRAEMLEWTDGGGAAVTVHVQPGGDWTALLLRRAPAPRPCAPDDRMKARLLHAQKMETVGRLAGGVAHDFNNLLTVIQSYCWFVTAELPLGTPARADMDEVVKAANCAADLTRQLLAFSRNKVEEPRRLDVNGAVTRTVGMLRRVLGEDIRIETDFAPEPCEVLADPGQLDQALMNLAVNARDAMPNGGTLRFRTAVVSADTASPRHGRELAAGRYVSLVVEDSGVGIAPEVLTKIFEAFYTTKDEGTGLGLAMVLAIAQRNRGDVFVESVPGRGSRFTLLLPCVDQPAAETPDPVTGEIGVVPAVARGGETILVVEDEPRVRAVIRRMLERHGYTVREAATGDEAFSIVASMPKLPDLLLTDVIMPVQSGPVLAERMRRRWPDLTVLFMSGYTEDEIRRRGLMGHDVTVLEKPLTLARLGEAVRRALDEARAA